MIGEWPGLIEDESEGPGGLQIRYDYRSVLSEVLVRVLGCRSVDKVFPGFSPHEVGLCKV